MISNEYKKTELTKKALSICKPPFEFKHGYIFDSDGHMVADHPLEEGILRIRGWGRIQYMGNPEQLQDEIGKLIAQAMTEFWEKNSENTAPNFWMEEM